MEQLGHTVADGAEPAGDDADDAVAGRGPLRPGRTALVASGSVALVVAILVVVLGSGQPASQRVTDSPLLGRLAPPVQGTTLEGDTFDLAELRGRWAVVNFFATWCVPCRVEHPELVAFEEQHAPLGDAAIVSVLYDDDPDEALQFFEERGGSWPVIIDPEGAIGVAYGVARVPETFLVAPDGTVVQRLVGGVTNEQLSGLIDQYEGSSE